MNGIYMMRGGWARLLHPSSTGPYLCTHGPSYSTMDAVPHAYDGSSISRAPLRNVFTISSKPSTSSDGFEDTYTMELTKLKRIQVLTQHVIQIHIRRIITSGLMLINVTYVFRMVGRDAPPRTSSMNNSFVFGILSSSSNYFELVHF